MAIKVDDYYVTSPVESILLIMKYDLEERGIYRFDKIKRTNNNVMTNCPFHSEGHERRPSFGISDKGECHCFACGWSSDSFTGFINSVYGRPENDRFGKDWLISRLSEEVNVRKIDININRNKVDTTSYISESVLDTYRYTHPYMYKRHLNDEIIADFDVGYDCTRHCLTFPVKDLHGNVVFVATRSVTGKFFTLPKSLNKPVYAADRFVSGKYSYAVICESILNALTCWKYGIPALALMGTGSKSQIAILQRLPVRKYILALDSDEAGEKGIDRIKKGLQHYKLLYRYNLPDGKDLNDLDDKILLLEENIL